MRPKVQEFARQMEKRLKENDHKTGWEDCSDDFLLTRLWMNFRQLRTCVSVNDHAGVNEAAADIANYAMMIADNSGDFTYE